ncbi:MAG: DUF72 domain-containing protein [Acidobacteriota bacterium]|nr:DUF72 domain-containing protein [Acidobacteriota bacterium]
MTVRAGKTVQASAAPLSTNANSVPFLKIGPAGWAYKDWAGYVYPQPRPKDFHPATFLAEYFDTIEINTSFYHPMKAEHAAQWIDRVAANPRFVFTAKLWKKFTHEHDATAADEREARAGLDILHSGNKLGALLLQFPFSFHREPETIAYLESVLKRFAAYPLVVEVRHASWNIPATFELLREHNAGFCNIDQPIIGRSLEPSTAATAPVGYVRLHGRRYDTWFTDDPGVSPHERYNYLYSSEELAPWAARIQKVSKQAETVFVITNNHYQGKGVVNALQLINILTKSKVNVPEPLRQHFPQLDAIAATRAAEPTLFPLATAITPDSR